MSMKSGPFISFQLLLNTANHSDSSCVHIARCGRRLDSAPLAPNAGEGSCEKIAKAVGVG